MMNGITYYKLKSNYEGDITKNCGLTGQEVDNNFYVLEGRDIKSVTVEDNCIVITLMNGETISSSDVFSNFAKDLTFEFDEATGTLLITQNGETTEISGFGPGKDCCFNGVYTDATLMGDGTAANPLTVSPIYRTGQYAPVSGFIDVAKGESMPDTSNLPIGTRYVVSNEVNDFGRLYNYCAIKQIACELQSINSEWRIPTKEDWDDMLNAIEPLDVDKDHNGMACNKCFGHYAGKYLKSKEYWKVEEGNGTETQCVCPCGRCCVNGNDPCNPYYCGEYSTCQERPTNISPQGIDVYGFDVLPGGFAIDSENFVKFGEQAYFWTGTVSCGESTAWVKRFHWDKSTVCQDVIPADYYASLRLVKDYNGKNYYGKEEILGDEYETVIMPSEEDGSKVWTSVNFTLDVNCSQCSNACSLYPDEYRVGAHIVYYIMEWDGCRWVSIRLNEGDTVTIVQNGTVIDYHLVINQENGEYELIPVSAGTSDEVLVVIQPQLDNLNAKIDQEIQDRIDGDNALGERIDGVEAKNEQQDTDINGLRDALTAEAEARAAKDQDLQDQIDAIEAGQGSYDNIIKKLITDGRFDATTSEVVLTHNGVDPETGEPVQDEIVRVQIPFDFGVVPE